MCLPRQILQFKVWRIEASQTLAMGVSANPEAPDIAL